MAFLFMPNNDLYKNKFRIQSARLYGYDYSWPGYYFVTICTKDRVKYFGDINNYQIVLNDFGLIAHKCWLEIPQHFPFVVLDEFIVMPNHVHGIIVITEKTRNPANKLASDVETQNVASLPLCRPDFASLPINYNYLTQPNKFTPQKNNLSSIIKGYKVGVKKYATINNLEFFWQARFHDRIIRNEEGYIKIQNYIINNPRNWLLDRNYAN